MLKSVALSAGLIAGAHAFWRMECPGRLGVARLDPLVNYKSISAHAHAIHGSSAFSDSSSTDELLNGQCTSCRVKEDKSGYWHPAAFFEDATTGQIEAVPQVGGMLSYYLLFGDKVTAFPKGFSMIAGNNTRRTYTVGDPSQPDPPKSLWASLGQTSQSDLEQRAVGFNCLNYAKPPEGTLYRHMLPDKAFIDENCADGLRFELMFPSCWNGKDLDSKNHKDHVAFPDLVITGNCPETHPVRVPSLLYEVIWDTAAFNNRSGRFVLSNGDVTDNIGPFTFGSVLTWSGFGYHGDFVTGWEPEFLQQAINTCTNPSGRIEDCPLFTVVDHDEAVSCKWENNTMSPVLAKENVLGPMPMLPGGMSVGGMPVNHGAGNMPVPSAPATVAPPPALPYRPGEKPANMASLLPGQAFKEVKPSSATPTTTQPSTQPADAVSSTTVPPPAAAPGDCGIQYVTNGNMVTEIICVEKVVTEFKDCGCQATSAPAVQHQHRRYAVHHVHGHHGKVL
ncbi:hypothetical protein E4U41_000914 [Claviceps citrina]|nr:hypothetical protein E4U41_000914 [Claviceps citrina]